MEQEQELVIKPNYITQPNINGFLEIEINNTFFYLKTQYKEIEIYNTIYEDDTNEALDLCKADGYGGWYAEPNENYNYYVGAMNGKIIINKNIVIEGKKRLFFRNNKLVFEDTQKN